MSDFAECPPSEGIGQLGQDEPARPARPGRARLGMTLAYVLRPPRRHALDGAVVVVAGLAHSGTCFTIQALRFRVQGGSGFRV